MKTKRNNIAGLAKLNSSKGITLIALVITIVILIILAGVAINLTLGENGIFNKAKYAVEQQKMAEVKERVELAIADIQTDKITKGEECTVDTIISELPGKISGITISKDGDNAKGTYNGCDFTITPDLKVTIDGYNPSASGSGNAGGSTGGGTGGSATTTYTVTFNGSNVTSNGAGSVDENATYTATLTATSGYSITSVTVTMGGTALVENTGYTYSNGNLSIPNVSEDIEIVAMTKKITISDLKAGDYIKYDTGVEGIGVITCRVLYEAGSEQGLQIISDKNVGTDITLGGDDWATASASYNSAIETLNNEAENYINTAYATDARCVGSLPTIDANGTFTEKDTENAGPVTLQFSSKVEGANNMKDTDTNYTSNEVEGIVRDKETMEALGIWTTEEKYWLASRIVNSRSSDCSFYVRYVQASGSLYISGLCSLYSYGIYAYPISNGLRPCFALRSDINITGGDGTREATAYTM